MERPSNFPQRDPLPVNQPLAIDKTSAVNGCEEAQMVQQSAHPASQLQIESEHALNWHEETEYNHPQARVMGTCPSGHILKFMQSVGDGIAGICDACSGRVKALYGCRQCDYCLCEQCVSKASTRVTPANGSNFMTPPVFPAAAIPSRPPIPSA